jgi:hypothetical protein
MLVVIGTDFMGSCKLFEKPKNRLLGHIRVKWVSE